MTIPTRRLELIPLTPRQLGLWVDNPRALERELGCSYRAEPLEGAFRDIVRGQHQTADAENFRWHTFWWIIRTSDRTAVGSACFKGPPNADGEVKIGYGLGEGFEHRGYMTEAVRALCRWARSQDGVHTVVAETAAEGFASQRVLERCGFREIGGTEAPDGKRTRTQDAEGPEMAECADAAMPPRQETAVPTPEGAGKADRKTENTPATETRWWRLGTVPTAVHACDDE